MTRERIEDMREVVLPFVRRRLLETNYENLGESDAEEFARDFNEILALAIKGLEQEQYLVADCISRSDAINAIQDKAKKLTDECYQKLVEHMTEAFDEFFKEKSK